jgi:DUF4097 and DUF4098 domain-containing protein YvlB
MRKFLGIAVLLPLAIALATVPASAGRYSGSSQNPVHWMGQLSANQLMTIKDVSGDVNAESAAGSSGEITATISGPDADRVHVTINRTSEGVEACVVFDDQDDACGHNHTSHNIRATVDFNLKVPRDVRLDAETVNGSVEANDLGSNAKVASVNGDASVSTAGYAEAKSVNGSVRVRMGRTDWPGELRLESVNGTVEATVPADLNADVRFETLNGNVQSDFPYTVSGGTSIGMHGGGTHIEARIGSGGRELRMQSVNGSIELRKE